VQPQIRDGPAGNHLAIETLSRWQPQLVNRLDLRVDEDLPANRGIALTLSALQPLWASPPSYADTADGFLANAQLTGAAARQFRTRLDFYNDLPRMRTSADNIASLANQLLLPSGVFHLQTLFQSKGSRRGTTTPPGFANRIRLAAKCYACLADTRVVWRGVEASRRTRFSGSTAALHLQVAVAYGTAIADH
jgi:hypothetical protein